jgi:uncharacterized membrane protein YqjE
LAASGPTRRNAADEKPIGEIVTEVSEKASLLVREEIELAKAEIEQKVKRITRGVIAASVAGFFALFALALVLDAAAWAINDSFGWAGRHIWPGFLIAGGLLFVLAGLGALFALRSFKAGTPPTPDRAIEEARLIREAIEHPEVQAAMASEPERGA